MKGFTLVELLITLAVMGTAVGIGTASYVSFNERQIVQQAASNFKSNLVLTQKRAFSGETDASICVDGTNPLSLNGWCMSPDYNAVNSQEIEGYQSYGSCGGDSGDPATTFPIGEIKTDLPGGVIITSHVEYPGPGYDNRDSGGRILFNAGSNRTTIRVPDGSNIDGDDTTLYTDLDHITYCFTSSFPSLPIATGNNVYKITVTDKGEIKDLGFVSVSSCP